MTLPIDVLLLFASVWGLTTSAAVKPYAIGKAQCGLFQEYHQSLNPWYGKRDSLVCKTRCISWTVGLLTLSTKLYALLGDCIFFSLFININDTVNAAHNGNFKNNLSYLHWTQCICEGNQNTQSWSHVQLYLIAYLSPYIQLGYYTALIVIWPVHVLAMLYIHVHVLATQCYSVCVHVYVHVLARCCMCTCICTCIC